MYVNHWGVIPPVGMCDKIYPQRIHLVYPLTCSELEKIFVVDVKTELQKEKE